MRWALAAALVASMSQPAVAGPRVFHDRNGPEMVEVPAGSFMMGAEEVEPMRGGEMRSFGPVRHVTIARPFAAGRTEITNRQFAAFVKASGHRPAAECAGTEPAGTIAAHDWRNPGYGRDPRPDEPVVCVSWHDAKAYVAWLSRETGKPYRLLSEAEWEYAARGGRTTRWPWGEGEAAACRYANIAPSGATAGQVPAADPGCDDGFATLARVGSLEPNGYGLYDMIGNVWEWVEDCSIIPYPAQPVDGRAVQSEGACERRAVRGGSWRTRLSRQKPTFRGRDPETMQSQIFGFRVARDL